MGLAKRGGLSTGCPPEDAASLWVARTQAGGERTGKEAETQPARSPWGRQRTQEGKSEKNKVESS